MKRENTVSIRPAQKEDISDIARMAGRMWDSHSEKELEEEFLKLLQDKEAGVFVSEKGGELCGFSQCQLRHDYVEGTNSSPVGYLEGIFVEEKFRRQGIARAMVEACQNWTEEKGCTEFASDCEMDNLASRKVHAALGFEEVNRIVCFIRKKGV